MNRTSRRIAKVLLSAVVILGAAQLLDDFVAAPYRCNAVLKEVQSRTEAAFAGSEYSTPQIARRDLGDLVEFQSSCATNFSYHVIVGINDELLKRHAEAVREFRTALDLNGRPEIYADLGAAELNAGNRPAAIADFVLACRFSDAYRAQVPAEIVDAVDAQLRISR